MEFNFLEYFYTGNFDDNIIIKNNYKSYSVAEIKRFVADEAAYIKTLQNENIVIRTENYFDFIVIFLACVFANKKIIISNNNNKQDKIDNATVISELYGKNNGEINYKFDVPRTENIEILLHTSGTTATPKIITKHLDCLIKEVNDLAVDLNIKQNDNLEFITTTPINHLFALTVYFLLGLNTQNIVNTDRINYPESLSIKNAILITSPSFLAYMKKYDVSPAAKPKMIISAGAKLSESEQEYFEKFSKTINIYGSSETGDIAYKESSLLPFKLFRGVKILSSSEDKTVIKTDYSRPQEITLDDKIVLNQDKTINIIGRKDRIFKIQEKRVSAAALEAEILKNEFIESCRLVNLGEKIGVIAVLNHAGIEYFIKNGINDLVINIKSKLAETFEIIPQRWKFIDEIPLNDMGKYDSKKIEEIFSINLSLPLIIKRTISEEEAEFEMFFYKNCNFFKGHFDDFPIVPGVIQLFYASYFAKIAFGKDFYIGQIKRIKFSNIIHSDTMVKLKLSKGERGLNFEYLDENKSYSSGVLPVENIFKELKYAE